MQAGVSFRTLSLLCPPPLGWQESGFGHEVGMLCGCVRDTSAPVDLGNVDGQHANGRSQSFRIASRANLIKSNFNSWNLL